jgi:hypothetical protein
MTLTEMAKAVAEAEADVKELTARCVTLLKAVEESGKQLRIFWGEDQRMAFDRAWADWKNMNTACKNAQKSFARLDAEWRAACVAACVECGDPYELRRERDKWYGLVGMEYSTKTATM